MVQKHTNAMGNISKSEMIDINRERDDRKALHSLLYTYIQMGDKASPNDRKANATWKSRQPCEKPPP